MEFELTTTQHPTATVVAVIGELDIATAPQLAEAIDRARAEQSGAQLVVDLTRTEFLDSSGVRTLANVARDSGHVAIVCPVTNRAVTRVMELTGFGAFLPVHETVGELGVDADPATGDRS